MGKAMTLLRTGKSLIDKSKKIGLISLTFVFLSMAFFAFNGKEPLNLFVQMVLGAFGDS